MRQQATAQRQAVESVSAELAALRQQSEVLADQHLKSVHATARIETAVASLQSDRVRSRPERQLVSYGLYRRRPSMPCEFWSERL
jgi:hypothetical protein